MAGVVFLLGRDAVPHWTYFFRNTLELASSESIEPGGPLLFWTSIEVMRWVIPIAVMGAVAFAPPILNDGDTFWHIAAGRWMSPAR